MTAGALSVPDHIQIFMYKFPAFFASLLITSASVHGAGFYLSEVGTPGSMGSAGVANPVNNMHADAAWANPAGLTGLEQNELMLVLAIHCAAASL